MDSMYFINIIYGFYVFYEYNIEYYSVFILRSAIL
jgi:hypothetical protein